MPSTAPATPQEIAGRASAAKALAATADLRALMIALRLEGHSLGEVARLVGRSRQRVHQILRREAPELAPRP